MATYHVGTSGWQYDHWRGVFYPDELPRDGWLSYYAGHFDCVEINNSFYREPSSDSWRTWREAVPDHFRFAVKASRFLTHYRRFRNVDDSTARVYRGAEQLGERLGPVLYQARPDFERTPENAERIETFLALLPSRHLSVLEFRHDSWYGEETLAQLRRYNVAFCCHDMQGSATPLLATAGFAYVRFHGPEARYAGSYDDAALQAWRDRLHSLGADVDEVWAFFNNDQLGYAVRNAATLRQLLTE
jgi:uncharacterized protein YecE (DUF72 family)